MIVKRYTGNDLEQIQQAIQQELGDGAVIVHTDQRNAKGLLGFGRRIYEVTAVAEGPAGPPAPLPEAVGNDLLEQQRLHYRGIRQAIRRLDERLEDVDEAQGHAALPPEARSCLAGIHDAWFPALRKAIRQRTEGNAPTLDDWRHALGEQLPVSPGLPFGPAHGQSGPSVCVFVGPTGVGKTTTLAKLASRCVLNDNLKVGMVTLDTFRLGAIDQLREYAKLLGVELTVAFSPSELQRHVAAFSDRDVVFVDTPGRSQFDAAGIQEIQQAIDELAKVEVVLHVTAGVRGVEAETIARSYRALRPTVLVLTKVDEAVCCDGLTRLFDQTDGIPVVYLTDGQRVPEDIHEAAPERLAELIVPIELAPSA
jgi:flagellar biosynthesis protein FlhF